MAERIGQSRGTFAPLLLWISAQFLILLVPVVQTPLWDQFPRPAESLAAEEMIVAEIVFSALLSPILFSSVSSSIMVIASSVPFLQLCGMLSAGPMDRLAAAGAYVMAWQAGLALWQLIGDWSDKMRMTVSALAIGWALGGVVIDYVRREFGEGALDTWLAPIGASLSILHGSAQIRDWTVPGVIVAAGVGWGVALRIRGGMTRELAA